MIRSAVRCSELVELATDWMEGSLDGVALWQLAEHLAPCPHCRSYVTSCERRSGFWGRHHAKRRRHRPERLCCRLSVRACRQTAGDRSRIDRHRAQVSVSRRVSHAD